MDGTVRATNGAPMKPFIFRCPTSTLVVQGFSDGGPVGDYFEAVECAACKHVHFVNPRTGHLLADRGLVPRS
jgi:hypothetical protein